MDTSVDHATIAATYDLIRPHVRRTPVICVDAADFGLESRPLSSSSSSSSTPAPSSPAVPSRAFFLYPPRPPAW